MENKQFSPEKPYLQGRVTYSDLDAFVYVASIKSSTASFLRRLPLHFLSRTVFFSQFRATFLLRSLSMPAQNRLEAFRQKLSCLACSLQIGRHFSTEHQQEGYLSIKVGLNKRIGFGLAARVGMDFIYCDRKVKLDRNSLTRSSLFF